MRYILYLLLTTNLVLTGCGGSSNSSDSGPGTPPPPTAQLQGQAVKGIVSNAQVSIFRIVGGGDLELYAETITTGSGKIEIDLSENTEIPEGPFKIVVSNPNGGANINCDSPFGCGSYSENSTLDINGNGMIDFGENLPASTGFELIAYLEDLSESSTFYVTPFTHIAAGLIEKSGDFSRENIQSSNSVIQNRFDLPAPIGLLQPEDLTDLTSELDSNQLYYGVLSALPFALAVQTNQSVEATLEQLKSIYENTDGFPDVSNEEETISIELLAILAQSLVSELSLQYQAETSIQSALTSANNIFIELETEAVENDTKKKKAIEFAEKLDRVKLLVSDFRSIVLTFLDEENSLSDSFEEKLDLIETDFVAAEEEVLTPGLEKISESLADITELLEESTPEDFPIIEGDLRIDFYGDSSSVLPDRYEISGQINGEVIGGVTEDAFILEKLEDTDLPEFENLCMNSKDLFYQADGFIDNAEVSIVLNGAYFSEFQCEFPTDELSVESRTSYSLEGDIEVTQVSPGETSDSLYQFLGSIRLDLAEFTEFSQYCYVDGMEGDTFQALFLDNLGLTGQISTLTDTAETEALGNIEFYTGMLEAEYCEVTNHYTYNGYYWYETDEFYDIRTSGEENARLVIQVDISELPVVDISFDKVKLNITQNSENIEFLGADESGMYNRITFQKTDGSSIFVTLLSDTDVVNFETAQVLLSDSAGAEALFDLNNSEQPGELRFGSNLTGELMGVVEKSGDMYIVRYEDGTFESLF